MSTSNILPGRVYQQLLFRPPPLDGEAVCSWLYRIAVENGHCAAGPLIKLARLSERVPLSATELTAEMLEWLCAATGCSGREIAACLKDTVGEALGAAPRRSTRRWLLRNSKRRVGQRFSLCQHCLAQDIPHWRGAWRFATTVRCDVHDTGLIDRCPACHALQLLSLQRARPLDECEECGAKLAMKSSPVTQCQSKLSDIDGSGQTWSRPGVIELGEFPVQVPFEHLFWDGIWTILSHALLRNVAQRLQTLEIPLGARSLLSRVANAPQRMTFEDLPIADRQVMLEFSRWLCEDWPQRFVAVFEQGRVLASSFGVREVDRPYWIDRAVDEHLNRQRYRPSVDEVQSAASWLAQHGAAQPSQLRLKQTLGLTESIQISKVLQIHTRPFTLRDLDLLLRVLQDEIDSADIRRGCRDAVVRDALVVASCVLSGQGIEAVRKLSLEQIRDLWVARRPRPLCKARASELIYEWQREYEGKVRPRWSGEGGEGSCYFVTRHALPYNGFGLPRLLTRCLKSIGYPDHWRGVGVLRDLRESIAPPSRVRGGM